MRLVAAVVFVATQFVCMGRPLAQDPDFHRCTEATDRRDHALAIRTCQRLVDEARTPLRLAGLANAQVQALAMLANPGFDIDETMEVAELSQNLR